MEKNELALETPKRARTYEYSNDSLGALPPMKRLKNAPEISTIIVSYTDEDDERDVVMVPVTEMLCPNHEAYVGTEHVANIYSTVSFITLRQSYQLH
jgi:hypothetical protein